MALQDNDIGAVTLFLSPERLGKLTQLTGSAKDAIELHQETLSLGVSLMNVIATIEISLRNSICENLSQYFATPDWLLNPPAPFTWKKDDRNKAPDALKQARRAEYAKLTQAEKAALDGQAFPNGLPQNLSHRDRVTARRNQIPVSNGQIIAEITLHFWKRLYSPDYNQELWRTTLKRTFPNTKVTRSQVADHLENIYQTRNRLAHHEPVLHKRFNETMTSIRFVIEHLGEKNPSPTAPLANLVAEAIAEVIARAQTLHAKLDAYRVAPNGNP